MRHAGRTAFAVLAALLGFIVGAALVLALHRTQPAAPPSAREAPSRLGPPIVVDASSQDAIVAAVQKVGPAVVNISTVFLPPAEDPLERIIRRSLGIPGEAFPRAGQGSGFVIDGGQGYILTNAHVVKGADRVTVLLSDGRQLDAEVVGVDPLTEVGVVQVPGGDLPAAELGSTEDVPIGSWVIAIGNPFGFENSVTVGVLSAKEREIKGPNNMVLHDLLQTDASINPGNSGGALVDLSGRVVGMPTAVIPYAQGMGFAVSIDVARQVAERLIETGSMPWLGIQHRPLLPEEARQVGLPEGKGSMIFGVVPDGPAEEAGLRLRDLIIRVDDRVIEKRGDLSKAIRSYRAGDTVGVVLIRGGREMTLSVELGAVPPELGGD